MNYIFNRNIRVNNFPLDDEVDAFYIHNNVDENNRAAHHPLDTIPSRLLELYRRLYQVLLIIFI